MSSLRRTLRDLHHAITHRYNASFYLIRSFTHSLIPLFRLFPPVFCILGFVSGGCGQQTPNPETWSQAISHKNLGLAYLERDNFENATREFETVCALIPDDPLGYANLALAYLHRQLLDQAEQAAKQALDRDGENAELWTILADVYLAQGAQESAIETLEKALEKDPSAVGVRYKFLKLLQRLRGPGQGEEASIAQLRLIVDYAPENVAALLELGELLVKGGQLDGATQIYRSIADRLSSLPAATQIYLDATLSALAAMQSTEALRNAIILGNLLKVDPTYRATRTALGNPYLPHPPLHQFGTIPPNLVLHEAPPLISMRYTEVTSDVIDSTMRRAAPAGIDAPYADVTFTDFDGDARLDLAIVRPDGIRLFQSRGDRFVEVTRKASIGRAGYEKRVMFADVDNDGLRDLYLINRGPNRLYRNLGEGRFTPAPTHTGGSGKQRNGAREGALFADFDHDGDLDLFLTGEQADQLYRNLGDGTFEDVTVQAGIARQGTASRAAVFGDFDEDSALDLFVADRSGHNRLYRNLRQGRMADWTARFGLQGAPPAETVTVGDYNNDGSFDLFLAGSDSPSCALFWNQQGRTFVQDSTSVALARLCEGLRIQSAISLDFDNDGFLDLIVVGASRTVAPGVRLIRNGGNGHFEDASGLMPTLPSSVCAVATGDYDGDGDLDLALMTPEGVLVLLRNDGGNANQWLDIQLAAVTRGGSKNNYYGIGSTIELNADTHYQSRIVTSPVTHFGLGVRQNADVLRVLWSNGVPQNIVSPKANQRIVERQRLKGSCPSLYVWDGSGYTFVTHLMTRSAIGALTDNAHPAFPDAAADYVKIRGDQLRPKGGRYTLQIVEELWDAVYLDTAHLLVIDHPATADIYVDEKYTLPPFPPFHVYTATQPRRPNSAVDHHGHDILPLLVARDDQYVSDFVPTAYQGLVEPHAIILDLGDLRRAKEIRLFLNGWVMPIEPSTNLALSQRDGLRATGPSLQVPDAQGRWQTVIPFIGFPAGEHKTIVVDLSGKFVTNDFRVRIETNLQIYWNQAFFTVDEPHVPYTVTRLLPQGADLHYRGFSRVYRNSPTGPYLRDYATVNPSPQWLPFEGMRTRYGDVTPLLQGSDDRYAIFSSGEEITVIFDATAVSPLLPGWTRDYVLFSDGWLKEGDLNTASTPTIEPLPFHEMSRYPYGPEESYPDSVAHQAYLTRYTTRWVSTRGFRNLIRRYGDALPALPASGHSTHR